MGTADGRDGRRVTGERDRLGVYAVSWKIWNDAYEVHVGEFNALVVRGGTYKSLQLFYKTGRMRVVIASANLVSYDWEYIENVSRVTPICFTT